jgi:ribosomal protein L37AE/L43A
MQMPEHGRQTNCTVSYVTSGERPPGGGRHGRPATVRPFEPHDPSLACPCCDTTDDTHLRAKREDWFCNACDHAGAGDPPPWRPATPTRPRFYVSSSSLPAIKRPPVLCPSPRTTSSCRRARAARAAHSRPRQAGPAAPPLPFGSSSPPLPPQRCAGTRRWRPWSQCRRVRTR